MVARGVGLGGLGERGEGIKKDKLVVKKCHGNVSINTGNVVSTIITMYGARCVLEILRGTLCKVYYCPTTKHTPETNTK